MASVHAFKGGFFKRWRNHGTGEKFSFLVLLFATPVLQKIKKIQFGLTFPIAKHYE